MILFPQAEPIRWRLAELAAYPLWVAHYTAAPEPALPAGWKEWKFWQHSEAGIVRGISAHVDLDRFRGTFSELFAMTPPQTGRAAGFR